MKPLVEALRRHVMAAQKLHADDTPVPVLAPGNGKTRRDGYGPMCETIGRPEMPSLRRYGLPTHPIARASIPRRT